MSKSNKFSESLSEALFTIGTGTELDCWKVVNAIEKMVGTAPNSADRETAKNELLLALLRK